MTTRHALLVLECGSIYHSESESRCHIDTYSRGSAVRLDSLHYVQALNDLSKDDVLAIEPGGFNGAEEELLM